MGIYFRLVNFEKRERIEPDRIGGGGVKEHAILFGPSAQLLAFLHMHGERDWTIINDTSGTLADSEAECLAYMRSEETFADVTDAVVARFNRLCESSKQISMFDDDAEKK